NPYPAFLALADEFVVTTDSVSMMAEAADTLRPLRLFVPSRSTWWVAWNEGSLAQLRQRLGSNSRREASVRAGRRVPPRRPQRVAEALIRAGAATWLHEFVQQTTSLQPDHETLVIMRRVERVVWEATSFANAKEGSRE
ncbi:MAG: mitochondrial fission ELM1 family protein, partial [Planctomycetes bacterium]|nr:mitochondrial fission ELM1 family protein [Planctomycetota bacterium]